MSGSDPRAGNAGRARGPTPPRCRKAIAGGLIGGLIGAVAGPLGAVAGAALGATLGYGPSSI